MDLPNSCTTVNLCTQYVTHSIDSNKPLHVNLLVMMLPSSCVTVFRYVDVTGDGLPDMATQDEVLKALESVGFEVQGPQTVTTPSND